MRKAHFDGYMNQLKTRGTGVYDNLYHTGNYRLIQPYDKHNAQIMVTPETNNELVHDLAIQF